jgi:membrane-associated phospholipid phosphatase
MKRLPPLSFISLYPAGSLMLSIIFLWIFCETAESVLTRDNLVIIDKWILRNVEYFRSESLSSFMKATTNFGGMIIIAPISFITVAYLIFKKFYDRAICLAIAVTGGLLLNNILKLIFHRPRPLSEASLIAASGWSFPSGHSMNSMIFYGILAYIFIREVPSWFLRIFIGAIACSVILVVGMSRIYLQVHYTSDVIAGFVCGLFWLCLCMTGMEIYRKTKDSYSLQGL